MNSIALVGRVIADPEIKYLESGTVITTVRLSVNRNNGKKNPQGYPESDVFNVKAFGKQAEALNEHVKKGTHVGITGRIELKKVEDGKGSYVDVIASSWSFVGPKTDANKTSDEPAFEEIPF